MSSDALNPFYPYHLIPPLLWYDLSQVVVVCISVALPPLDLVLTGSLPKTELRDSSYVHFLIAVLLRDEADIDGSCRPWTEVAFPPTPPYSVKV